MMENDRESGVISGLCRDASTTMENQTDGHMNNEMQTWVLWRCLWGSYTRSGESNGTLNGQ